MVLWIVGQFNGTADDEDEFCLHLTAKAHTKMKVYGKWVNWVWKCVFFYKINSENEKLLKAFKWAELFSFNSQAPFGTEEASKQLAKYGYLSTDKQL